MKVVKLSCVLCLISSAQIGLGADIVWVHQNRGGGGSLAWEDDQWRALIEGQGHSIVSHEPYDNLEELSLDDYDAQIAEFNEADLVIFSRDSNSGDYNDPLEHIAWTSDFSTPMIVMTPYLLRNNRWGMVDNSSIVDAAAPMFVAEPEHPIFEGIELTDDEVEFFMQLGPDDNIDLVDTTDFGLAQVLAEEAVTGVPWIAYWDGETDDGDFFDGSANFAGGPRLFLSAGSDDDPNTWGEKNITEAGDQIFLNAIAWLTGDPGSPVDPGGVCVPGTGDFNGNGTVDFNDFIILATNFGMEGSADQGDLDCSGNVDFLDFLGFAQNFGQEVGAAAALAAVPEPSGLLLFACGILAMGSRRRRR